MSAEEENDDQWLYGDQPDPEGSFKNDGSPATIESPLPEEKSDEVVDEVEEPTITTPPPPEDDGQPPPTKESDDVEEEKDDDGDEDDEEDEDDKDKSEPNDIVENGDDDDDVLDDSDDDDDDVNVVIGDIKTTPSYTSLNLKSRTSLLSSIDPNKTGKVLGQQQLGKFTMEEFEQSGMINGVPSIEYNLDSLEEKPWRKPGADITDYFNYGFNEDTWRAYCERQRRMRTNESGVGLTAQINPLARPNVSIMNDNSKYSGTTFMGVRKAGPPPGRRIAGPIDVIGSVVQTAQKIDVVNNQAQKMNVIEVMTADRREYSRKPTTHQEGGPPSGNLPDMSMPPPLGMAQPPTYEDYDFNPEPEPFYGSGYEPTQDSQWGGEPTTLNWTPNDLSVVVPMVAAMPPPPTSVMPAPSTSPRPIVRDSSPPPQRRKSRSRSKERSSSRAHSERPRDRSSRDHRRDRSRSRSRRRHKSRSRSPSHHRSHKKKKSSSNRRQHDESE